MEGFLPLKNCCVVIDSLLGHYNFSLHYYITDSQYIKILVDYITTHHLSIDIIGIHYFHYLDLNNTLALNLPKIIITIIILNSSRYLDYPKGKLHFSYKYYYCYYKIILIVINLNNSPITLHTRFDMVITTTNITLIHLQLIDYNNLDHMLAINIINRSINCYQKIIILQMARASIKNLIGEQIQPNFKNYFWKLELEHSKNYFYLFY